MVRKISERYYRKIYHEENKTAVQCAKILGISKVTFLSDCKEMGILKGKGNRTQRLRFVK